MPIQAVTEAIRDLMNATLHEAMNAAPGTFSVYVGPPDADLAAGLDDGVVDDLHRRRQVERRPQQIPRPEVAGDDLAVDVGDGVGGRNQIAARLGQDVLQRRLPVGQAEVEDHVAAQHHLGLRQIVGDGVALKEAVTVVAETGLVGGDHRSDNIDADVGAR